MGSGRDLLTLLAGRWTVRERPSEVWRRTLLETFDWRLWDAGRLWMQSGRTGVLVWEGADERRASRAQLSHAPAFAEDLPDQEPWPSLATRIEPRRLLEWAELVERRRRLDVLDAEDKTVARLAIVEATVASPGDDEPRELPTWIEVEELRGYPHGSEIRALLVESDEFEPLETDGFALALAELEIAPGVDPSRLELDVPRLASARVATVDTLEALFDVVLVNEPGVREDTDIEFLHDLRVAVRRSRSLLSDLGHVFEADLIQPWIEELRWLGGASGSLRDLDVLLHGWGALTARIEDSDRLTELREAAEARRAIAREALVAALDSARFTQLAERWPAFLREQRQALEPRVSTIEAEVHRRLWRRFRRVLKRGRALNRNSEAESFHRVRIQAKKLRYLLELHRPVWPKQEVRAATKLLKRVQDRLGEFNDAEVQAALLRDLAVEGRLSSVGLLAAGELVDSLRSKSAAERERFFEVFAEFAGDESLARFARLAGRGVS